MISSDKKGERVTSVVFTGVGGQGVLLASHLTAYVAMNAGFDVKQAEVHGMSQRGGSVISHVRFGGRIHSPTVPIKSADILCSFEPVEALRHADLILPGGTVIFNSRRIVPLTAYLGKIPYPESPGELLRNFTPNVVEVDASKVALDRGLPRALNVAMLGVVSLFLPFSENAWTDAIEKNVKKGFAEKNVEIFVESRAVFNRAGNMKNRGRIGV